MSTMRFRRNLAADVRSNFRRAEKERPSLSKQSYFRFFVGVAHQIFTILLGIIGIVRSGPPLNHFLSYTLWGRGMGSILTCILFTLFDLVLVFQSESRYILPLDFKVKFISDLCIVPHLLLNFFATLFFFLSPSSSLSSPS